MIGINFFAFNEVPDKNAKDAPPILTLGSKILRKMGWEIMDVTQRELEDMELDKIKIFKDWIKEAKARQIEKGIMIDDSKIEYV